jgi:hypothetical protein
MALRDSDANLRLVGRELLRTSSRMGAQPEKRRTFCFKPALDPKDPTRFASQEVASATLYFELPQSIPKVLCTLARAGARPDKCRTFCFALNHPFQRGTSNRAWGPHVGWTPAPNPRLWEALGSLWVTCAPTWVGHLPRPTSLGSPGKSLRSSGEPGFPTWVDASPNLSLGSSGLPGLVVGCC